jgi:amino acid adenylation domain-containing protein
MSENLENLGELNAQTLMATSWESSCEAASESDVRDVPIGRPVHNVNAYVLDRDLQPVPVGVPGELYLGGVQLARGYLNQPQLTADRFVPNPFSVDDSGTRLYRTGDLTRLRPDGAVEFLGRTDHQVKVRGYRIELGEIEAVLRQHPSVKEVIVVAREGENGAKQLVAYHVSQNGARPVSGELREYVGQSLPQYMIPQAFVWLDEWPRLPNGKINRELLPIPERNPERASPEPATLIEEILIGIWADVLGVNEIDPTDNFFELGGHSLLAVQLASRVRTALQVELPLRWLFESPTLAALAERIEQARQNEAGLALPPITPVFHEGPLPLSFAQERLWIIDQLETGSAVYNISTAVKLDGSLHSAALEQSLAELVRRHKILRTSFVEVDGQPAQVITESVKVPLRVVHLGQHSSVAEIINDETSVAFDLTVSPLMRARLVRISDNEHALVLTFHHIISDGWSMGVLIRELTALYNAFSNGEPSPLPELELQYADYAAWQRRYLQGEVLDQQLGYWKQQLAGVSELVDLPLDHPRPPVRRYRGAIESRQLPASLSESLKTLSQGSGSTLFMTLLAAFQLILSRYSGQEDIVVGAPSAGRNHTELEGQIGFFINTLALRTDLSGNPSFVELLARVRQVALDAFAHEDAPFEKLLEELQLGRDLSRTPLLQVFFNMLNLPNQSAELPGLRIEPLSVEAGAKFDLTFYIAERRDGLVFNLVYDADLFAAARMSEMLEQFECVLEQIVAQPEKAISNYSLVTPSARALLPDATITLPVPLHGPITTTFFALAEAQPEHKAICGPDRSWTYAELSQRARAVAQTLLREGLRRGDVVAVSGEPSFDLIAALLGIMAAGGVILPLDSNLPDARREMMIREAGATRSMNLDRDFADPASLASLPLIDPDDPAYVFFTSGTTGVPKAVLGCHKGLSHFLHWQRNTFQIGAGDRCAQLTGLSFDVVMRDIFLPLTSGASLHTPNREESLLSWFERERITAIHTVPTIVQTWLSDVPAGVTLRSLRYAFLAGEPLTDSLVRRWRTQFPEAGAIVNLYGPTETTLAKCFYVVPKEPSFGVQPVGRPLPQTQALVLNNERGLCGIGERGEITIRTPFRTLGYLNQSGENRRFVGNPFAGDIIYRTGDLGRYRPDGTLEIAGRVDDQIKIRGVRIEPSEVTAVLLQHAGVQAGAVVGYKDAEGNSSLAAYIVSTEGDRIATDVRSFLTKQLPAAMVPASFNFVDELPLTPNGKLDRRRLPAPDLTQVQTEQVAPRSWTEEVIAGIWTEVLRRDQVGVHDDFFELGGHSLLATQVIARVRQAFHVDLPLRRLFERPTVASLAETINEAVRGKAELTAPAIEPVRRDASLPLSFAQERLWFLYQLQPESFAYNMTARLDLDGPLNIVALDQATIEIIRRHEILRTIFAASDGRAQQRNAAPPREILTVVDLTTLSAEEQESQSNSLATQQAQRPFDLARGPVLRGILLELQKQRHELLLGIHHIAADAWSTTIFIQEVGHLYGSFLRGEHSQLPELALQYVDFAAWQRGWLQGDVLETQLAYWREQLKDSPPMLELPTDRPRPAVQTFRGNHATLNISEELTAKLIKLSRRAGTTPFMTLMAIFKTLLYRYTGVEDNVVGTGIAERKSVELERMIGLFINQLAIRTRFSGQQTFAELLRDVRDTSLAAYAHQDLPFEKLVAELQPERSLSRTPLFQVMLTMQTAPGTRANLTDVQARLKTKAGGGAKFDLTMHVIPTATELRLILEYNTVLFNEDRIARLLGHFESLIEAVTTQPEQRLCDLPLLTEKERSELLVEWNDTAAPHPIDVSMNELIETQTERTPDVIAVECDGATLSYRELNCRANQVAHFLRALHVGPDVMVGICLERSLEMIVAMLGVLKAGGAYVPLDPAYPAERIEFMLDDTEAPVLLTQAPIATAKEFEKRSARVVCLDRDWAEIAKCSDLNFKNQSGADRLAYIIYTSGSTGRPKGVAIQHSSAVTLLAWAATVFSAEELKGVLASTSICFDLSIFEIFVPLSVGGRVIVVADALRLPSLKSAEAVTLLNTVPSAAAELLRSGGLPKTLQTVNLAGEPLATSLVRQLYEYADIKRVFDLYGPSEDTTYSTFALRSGTGQATIGRAISNTQTYVLDRNLQPMPVGVPGELYLGGEGLARGYLNRPELTAAKFIPDPFAQGRLYKTGDLVRYLSDGRLEYLGRTDHQIKLRGFRIELGEIQAVLRQHPQIQENIVLVREDEPGDRRLVAYLVTNENIELSIGDLRTFLRKKLPDYMVPSAFIRLDALPLNANGKIDRAALPTPDDPISQLRQTYVAPRAELERNLAKIWQETLRIAAVGVEDNFFDLGGHSLLLVRVVQEIQNSLGLEVSLMEMFEHPTIASLSRHLTSKQTDAPKQQTPPVESTSTEETEGRRRRRLKRLKASNNT